MATINWKGPEVLAKMAEAAKVGIDKTMSDCVSSAKTEHPYEDQTALLTSSIHAGRATIKGAKVSGSWGSDLNYSLFIEIGTSRIGATAFEREQAGGGDMWAIPDVQPAKGVPVLQSFTIVPPDGPYPQYPPADADFHTEHRPSVGIGNPGLVAPRPFLRPAADRNYGKLRYYIGAAYRGERF